MGNSAVFESILQMAQGQQGGPSGEGGTVPGQSGPMPGRIGARPPIRPVMGKPGAPAPPPGGGTDMSRLLPGKGIKKQPGMPVPGKLPAPGGDGPWAGSPGGPGGTPPRGIPPGESPIGYPEQPLPMPPGGGGPFRDWLPLPPWSNPPDPTIGNGTGSNSRTSTDWLKRHPEERAPQMPQIPTMPGDWRDRIQTMGGK